MNVLPNVAFTQVAQLAGAVAELTLYLHGEASLNSTIIHMAQDFPGSNNVNLLVPNGAFGTRLANGHDAASPRYVYTCAAPVTRKLLRSEDDALLERLKEEGQDVEPRAFWPVLPLLLLNGSDAIATGYSSDVPAFNPREVLQNVRRMLAGEEPQPMSPWFRGFRGDVSSIGPGKWRATGTLTGAGDTWTVTELPPKTSFNKFVEWLESEKSPATLLENRCTDTEAHFKIQLKQPVDDAEAAIAALSPLTQTVGTANMHAFDADGRIKKYASAEDVLREWVPWRLERYADRRAHLVKTLEAEALSLESRARFIRAVCAKQIDISAHKEDGLLALLEQQGYDEPKKLLALRAGSFTIDRAAEAESSAAKARAEAVRVEKLSPRDLWAADLDEVDPYLT